MIEISRRKFVGMAAGTSVAAMIARNAHGASPAYKTVLKKAVIRGLPDEKALSPVKAAGFDGFESNAWSAPADKAKAARKAAETVGLRIHSVMRGWTQFNDANAAPKHIESVKTALRTAALLGADAILLVPCRIGVKPMPAPTEFDIEFDSRTGHVTRVVKNDNDKYAAYIKAQNQATDMSRAALEKLVPTAEETGVVIAVENVWNNLWVKPDLFANFVRSFDSKWIRAYFDIGNHVKYAPPEEWIRALGELIRKCHVKDFKLSPDGNGGNFVNIRDGNVNWPAVRSALDKIGYNGWMTIEGSGKLSLTEQSERLDLIVKGV